MRCGRSAGSPRSSWALGLVFRKLWSQADRRVLSVNQMKGSAFWPIFSQTKTTMPRTLPSRPILHKPRKRDLRVYFVRKMAIDAWWKTRANVFASSYNEKTCVRMWLLSFFDGSRQTLSNYVQLLKFGALEKRAT